MTKFKKYLVRFSPPKEQTTELRFNNASEIVSYFNISSMSVFYKIKAKQLKYKHQSTKAYRFLEIIKEKRPPKLKTKRHFVSVEQMAQKFH